MTQRRLTAAQFRALKPRRKKPQDAKAYFVRAWSLKPLAGVVMETEYRFHPTRRWKFDAAFPRYMVAVEVDGHAGGKPCSECGMRSGRHSTISGMREDNEKLNAAIEHGWRVLRFVAADKGRVNQWVDQVKRVIAGMMLP